MDAAQEYQQSNEIPKLKLTALALDDPGDRSRSQTIRLKNMECINERIFEQQMMLDRLIEKRKKIILYMEEIERQCRTEVLNATDPETKKLKYTNEGQRNLAIEDAKRFSKEFSEWEDNLTDINIAINTLAASLEFIRHERRLLQLDFEYAIAALKNRE